MLSFEIGPDFAIERPGAIIALKKTHGIPADATVICEAGYVRFWSPMMTPEQARPFYPKHVQDAVLAFFGPPSCACPDPGDWSVWH